MPRGDAPCARIDLEAMRANVRRLRRDLAPGVQFMAAVKADAYGHGLLPIARALSQASARGQGADAFGVATAAEALTLRANGIREPILVFSPVRERLQELIDADVSLTVAQPADLHAIHAAAAGKDALVHVKVDTGMGRLGADGADAVALTIAAARQRGVNLQAVWTHLACADESTGAVATQTQLTQLDALLNTLAGEGITPPMVHAANSAGTLLWPSSHRDMVRPGIAVYGVAPSAMVAARVPELRAVMTLTAPITFIKRVRAGTPIGYGHTWSAPRDTVVATLRIGYADGYPRSLSSLGRVLWRDQMVTVAGRVCMDQVMVDLGPHADAALGEHITLWGGDAEGPMAVSERAGSFAYELLTGIAARVERVYQNL